MMNVEEAILTRHAVRLFNPDDKISRESLEKIVELAQHAPSWVDSQPWKVYIATGNTLAAVKKRHAENVKNGVKANPDWATTHREDWAKFPRENMLKHNEATAHFWENPELSNMTRQDLQIRLYDTPAICYLTIPKDSNQWSDYDLGAFGQTLMLAARGMGIDSMPAYEIVKFPESVKEIMNIPDSEWLAMGIALGYADMATRVNEYRAPRVPLDEMLKIKD